MLCFFSCHDCELRRHCAFDGRRKAEDALKEVRDGERRRGAKKCAAQQWWTERTTDGDALARTLLCPRRRQAAQVALGSVLPRLPQEAINAIIDCI